MIGFGVFFYAKKCWGGARWQIFVNVDMKKCAEIWEKMGWGRNFMKKLWKGADSPKARCRKG